MYECTLYNDDATVVCGALVHVGTVYFAARCWIEFANASLECIQMLRYVHPKGRSSVCFGLTAVLIPDNYWGPAPLAMQDYASCGMYFYSDCIVSYNI